MPVSRGGGPYGGGAPRTPPRPPGPRRAALERRAKDRRRRESFVAVAAILAGVLAVAAVVVLFRQKGDEGRDQNAPSIATANEQPIRTTLFFGTRETSNDVVWLSLVSYNRETESGSVVYIPAHTASEIPGRGLNALAQAHATGGIPLLLISTENLLGIKIDRYIELSDRDAQVLFDATGPVSVDVPAEVRVARGPAGARVIFGIGKQRLPARFLVQLLYTVGLEGDDVELGTRHIAFWQGLLDRFAEDPGALADAVKKAGPALSESDTDPAQHAAFLETLARVGPENMTLSLLPVEQVSVGGDELYAADGDEIAAFLTETLGARLGASREVRVQVLNGNGVPGIGQKVADLLVGKGFRVIVSANARRFNYDETLIVMYDDSPESDRVARRARSLLGVGEIQVSTQSQGIVDLTIVIGKDFLRKR